MRGPCSWTLCAFSTITGGGSEARMLPRPRITPVRVNLPPNQDVVRAVSSYIPCRAYRREIFHGGKLIVSRSAGRELASSCDEEPPGQSSSGRFPLRSRVNDVNCVQQSSDRAKEKEKNERKRKTEYFERDNS